MPRKPLHPRAHRDHYPEPPPIGRQPLSPEQEGEDDRLEPPGVNTRVVLWIGGGLAVFIAVSLTLLVSFYRLETGGLVDPAPKTFPMPRLEASIDPRVVPASGPGPAQTLPPVVPKPAAEPLDRAMQIVAARGLQAYDPPASPGARPAAGRAP